MTIEQASADFEEAARPTHADVAEMIAEYGRLKKASRITKDGEVIDRMEANRKEDGLNRAIKKALVDLGEAEMFVEGVGSVRLRDTDSIGYRLDAMEPHNLVALLEGNVLSVKRGEVTEKIEGTTLTQYKPAWAWLKQYEVRGTGATQLLFEESK